MTPATEKLKFIREKVTIAAVFDNHFRQLIGIELFDFIQANSILKDEFDRRLTYLKTLAADKDFKLLQDNLFETIQKMLKLTSLQEVEERQKEWNNELKNRLKTKAKKDFLTLPELYLALQNKDDYYRLGDRSYFSSEEGEVSIVTPTISVRKQYEVNVEGLFKLIFLDKFVGDKKGCSRLDRLINQYDEYWYKLDELIYRIPIQLHLSSFERFVSNCIKFHPRQGYEWHHIFVTNSADRNNEKAFKEVKENVFVILDDLIEVLTITKKIVPQKSKNYIAVIPIKSAGLDERDYLLEINNGEKLISFKSKKNGEGLEKETKQFKILYHLWNFRWELKDDRVLTKGDFVSLDNLVKGSGSESTEAAYKHIQRLNHRFKSNGVAIEITGENEKYRLIINKA